MLTRIKGLCYSGKTNSSRGFQFGFLVSVSRCNVCGFLGEFDGVTRCSNKALIPNVVPVVYDIWIDVVESNTICKHK